MKYLKTVIEKRLEKICNNVFLEDSEDDSPFPYLVYSIANGVNNRPGQHIYTLFVDIWDRGETTRIIDDFAKKLKKLDAETYIDKNLQYSMYFDRILNTKSEHKDLKRKTLVFELRVIERS